MVMGNALRDRDVQYVASKDETTHTWRILNTWSDELKTLQVEDEVPDDCPAVKVLTEGEFIALIKEAARLGVLENATFGTGEAELEAVILDKDQEIQKLNETILSLKENNSEVIRNSSHTEDYDLKEKAMDSIIKLVSLQDVANLSKEQKYEFIQ